MVLLLFASGINPPCVWAQVSHLFSTELAKSLFGLLIQLVLQNFTQNTMIYVKEWRGHLSQMHCFEENGPKSLVFMDKCAYMRFSTWNWSTFYWVPTSVHKPHLAVSLKAEALPGRCDTWLPIPDPESTSLITQSEDSRCTLLVWLDSEPDSNGEVRSTQAKRIES